MTRKSDLLKDWVGELQCRARRCIDAALDRPEASLARFRSLLAQTTGCEISEPKFRDACAEALAWMFVYSGNDCDDGLDSVLKRAAVFSPFVVELLAVWRSEDEKGLRNGLPQPAAVVPMQDLLFLYEFFLAIRAPSTRMERGVYYTPRVLARHIVERVDNVLREQFGLADGLADTATWSEMQRRWPTLRVPAETSGDKPFVRILDPAAGTGIFLIEVVDRIHRTLVAKWRAQSLCEAEILVRWNEFVPTHLLPRMVAIELMPTPSVISQIAVAQKLAETGYSFDAPQRLQFSIADALLEPNGISRLPLFQSLHRSESSPDVSTVILGNPPFRGVSSNSSNWINKLLRGMDPDNRRVANYYQVDGRSLGERKLWLQDDYVKFMRYAHWQIERAGIGVVGFVTNHGYLDNATFRGMRQAMLGTFQHISLFDLHGNRKKNKTAPDGGSDEGMFDIEQGVAIGIFSRTSAECTSSVTHREVWGSRETKARAIAEHERVVEARITPQSPNYLFVPVAGEQHPEYGAGFALNEVMPVNSTAVVTARDSFVVGFDEASLIERMIAFCDESVSDDAIRQRFFTSSRSTKYPRGDTRGWKLTAARRRMRQEVDWESHLRPCLYRPFDRRVIFWADWMIDWPRQEITRHLLARPNLALVARRQMPPTGPCNHFWITDTIGLDGLIRSDNRGSESIFPLWLEAESARRQINLASQFVAEIASKLGLAWDASGAAAADDRFGPEDVLHYIYGLFNAPAYRDRYAEMLRRDFPRVLIPNQRSIWTAFRDVGERLTKLHVGVPQTVGEISSEPPELMRLDTGYPKFAAGEIWLGKGGPVVSASESVWNFHVGAHQVCRKWLRDRGEIGKTTLAQFEQIVGAIAETLSLTAKLDALVATAGGWDAIFSA